MQFVTVRDFRSRSSRVWERLKKEREVIVTSNGRPVAILSGVEGDNLEESLSSIRSAHALSALNKVQTRSAQNGLSNMGLEQINTIIADVRKRRKR